MILVTILILLAAAYCYSFYFTGLSLWFYFLWVPCGLLLSFLSFVLFLRILFIYMKRTDPKGKFRHWLLHQSCRMILLFANIKVEIIGKEFVPREPFVCYANHKSDIDPIILYYALKSVCSAVGKKSLFKNPVLKQIKPVFGVISLDRDNDREAAKSMIEAIREVKAGLSMMIFPEGGIKSRDTEEMVNLRAGAYKLVTKSGAYLLPATILGSSQTKKRKTLLKRIHVKVIFHKPLSAQEYEPYNTTELGKMVMEIIHQDIVAYEQKKN